MLFWRYIITALDPLAPGCGTAALALLNRHNRLPLRRRWPWC
jgi:hypothetical protein